MRVVSAVLLSVLLFCATLGYTKFADSVRREPPNIQAEMDDAQWRLRISRTFDCIPDPESQIASLSIQFKGEDVFHAAEMIPLDAPVEINQLPEVEQGDNELFIAANLATLDDFDFNSDQVRALRVEIFRGDNLVQDQTIWSEPGATAIEESVLFQAPRATATPPHDHD